MEHCFFISSKLKGTSAIAFSYKCIYTFLILQTHNTKHVIVRNIAVVSTGYKYFWKSVDIYYRILFLNPRTLNSPHVSPSRNKRYQVA